MFQKESIPWSKFSEHLIGLHKQLAFTKQRFMSNISITTWREEILSHSIVMTNTNFNTINILSPTCTHSYEDVERRTGNDECEYTNSEVAVKKEMIFRAGCKHGQMEDGRSTALSSRISRKAPNNEKTMSYPGHISSDHNQKPFKAFIHPLLYVFKYQ